MARVSEVLDEFLGVSVTPGAVDVLEGGQCAEAGTTTPIPPQETEQIWHGSSDPQKVLQLHHQEHPDWLHHCLVWQLLCLRPQGTTESSTNGPVSEEGPRNCQRLQPP